MSKQDQISLLILVAIFVVLQVMGLMGAVFGTGKISSVNYVGWPGYFIVVGATAIMVVIVTLLAFLITPIVRGIANWIDKENSDETGTRSETTNRTLHQHFTAPITSIPTTVRSGPEDDVQSAVSGCPPITGDQLTRRALRDHAASHVSR